MPTVTVNVSVATQAGLVDTLTNKLRLGVGGTTFTLTVSVATKVVPLKAAVIVTILVVGVTMV